MAATAVARTRPYNNTFRLLPIAVSLLVLPFRDRPRASAVRTCGVTIFFAYVVSVVRGSEAFMTAA
jgi:hypothetical protein